MTKDTKPKFEMNEEQKRLFDDLAPLNQKACINSLSGMSNIDSYEAAGGKGKSKKTREASASRMLSNVKAKAFLDSMKKASVNDAVMSRDEMMQGLTLIADVATLKEGQLSLGSITELKDGFNIKLKAMNQLAEVAGYKSASKLDHTSSDGSMTPKGKSLDDFYSESKE